MGPEHCQVALFSLAVIIPPDTSDMEEDEESVCCRGCEEEKDLCRY